ncbi:heterokaryon incompatibility protein [Colletotrichum plurivorum]|uniref:Heterokaryon incompatibility protein n=1 Tax=Colletotrichum plurivorum TaxID=2175906 RepID=A0A8H6JY92_9PEZI|nr:heterokaryon incompatibility protein [Colletotrichum plurivorum]
MSAPSETAGIAYRGLNAATHEFRLLYLKPFPPEGSSAETATEDLVKGELQHYRLSKTPSFVALSYCWGQAFTQNPIVIDGTIQKCGVNGELALRHLRRQEGVYVWIDQLCINQNDNAEKSHQVQMMRDIYVAATRVAVWMGLPADDSDLFLPHVRIMAALVRDEKYVEVIRAHADISFLQKMSHAFRAFCGRQYWTRLWIIQEFAVARDLDILCGKASISYADLKEFLLFVSQTYLHFPKIQATLDMAVMMALMEMIRGFKSPATSYLEGVFTRRRRYQTRHVEPSTNATDATPGYSDELMASKGESLFAVLVTTMVLEMDYNHTQATDPRDRVFAVMHFADDVGEFEGLPNYSLSCEDVYHNVARRILMQGNIDLLSYCQFPRDAALASWAPDWRMGVKKPCVGDPWHSKFSASGDSIKKQDVAAPDAKTIKLRGVVVDVVKETGNVWDPDWVSELDCKAAMAYIDEIETLCTTSQRFADKIKEQDFKEVMRVCIADKGNYREPERQQGLLEGFVQSVLWMKKKVSEQDPDAALGIQMADSMGIGHWYASAIKCLHSRRPVVSETGYVGLAQMHALPGDKIVIFLGGKTPYVVRELGEGSFELVGEAYVHGIMYGEFMTDGVEIRDLLLR